MVTEKPEDIPLTPFKGGMDFGVTLCFIFVKAKMPIFYRRKL
jgi:hypothetical protein